MAELLEEHLNPDPMAQLTQWYNDAVAAGLPQPDAMTLATAATDGRPSARMVLMKQVDGRGVTFFSNYMSRKGKELESNPFAALIFYWEQLGRQVRIEGTVEKLSPEESNTYFQSRPFENKVSSLVSPQSKPISRGELLKRYESALKEYEGKIVRRPPHWGGYRVAPGRVEFWQRALARLNDRIEYSHGPDGRWVIQRLAP